MRAAAYTLVRRTMTQDQRNRLKRQVALARRRLEPLYVARHGRFGASDLRAELERRLPPDFEILMVHCSLNDMKPMYGEGPGELLDALLALCGPDRTLAMPAFFFGGADADVAAYYRARPRFDVRRQPSQMGLLSEVFRRRPGVLRSVHPSHSVCATGPLAEDLTATHHLAPTTFGAGTPFGVMTERRTVITGLGAEYFRCLTHIHAAEDLLGDEYPIALRPERVQVTVTDRHGERRPYALPVSPERRTAHIALLEDMLGPGELTRWRFHGVRLFTTTAARVTEALIDAARHGRTLYDGPAAVRGQAG